ncbi:hypothetical protein GGD56_006718 [Rhizobium mongolense]|uniref:BAAT/Acyl-CoA thioester hydrolase C-terminal domain-containing protein n=2 Tax=Rhizobium mongolense TaxID=57676 RepID=A0ABR6IZE4_9HYPH|nr:acyl-CoA thioester hydrolase/BAAT C-terminal domain-containing protein [Rhizobium mongolense]MBB4232819.1 hypothetical protein [Rhizobium mongolense]
MSLTGGQNGESLFSPDRARVSMFHVLRSSPASASRRLPCACGKGQAPGVCEVPLETFVQAIDELEKRSCKQIAIAGTSKGAEAALPVAARDERVDAVFAMSPTSVVWGNIGPRRDGIAWPERSSWTWKSEPLPFVPTDSSWTTEYANGLVSYRSFFEHCLQRFAKSIPAATIPVEQSRANIVLIAGG